jgi:hypothetical protein
MKGEGKWALTSLKAIKTAPSQKILLPVSDERPAFSRRLFSKSVVGTVGLHLRALGRTGN